MKQIVIHAAREQNSAVCFQQNALSFLAKNMTEQPFVLTDENVFRLYGDILKKEFSTASVYTMSAGEAYKTPETLLNILTAMAETGLKRNATFVAFGGGVVCDMGGLAASLYMRGIECVYVPTTLLSCVDACIGGKTAVDFCGVKNLLGTFRMPHAVLIDPQFLHSLPRRELVCGLGEVVKHAALAPSLFEKLCAQADLFDLDFLSSLIPENVMLKAGIVESDPFDEGARAALNLGHTTAHAVELTNVTLSHGECVLCGIIYEAELAKKHLSCDKAYLGRLQALCTRILSFSPKELDLAKAAPLACMDKKNAGDEISCIVPTGAGEWARLQFSPKQYEEELLAVRSML